MQVFVANPNKPQDVKMILAKNHEKLVELLQNLYVGKGKLRFKKFAPGRVNIAMLIPMMYCLVIYRS